MFIRHCACWLTPLRAASFHRSPGRGALVDLWAGPETLTRAMRAGEQPIESTRRQSPVSLGLGFTSEDLSYSIDLGMPSPSASAFALDAVIKGEFVWAGPVARPAGMLVERTGPVVRSRDSSGAWELATERLSLFDSMLSQLADPQRMPELLRIREKIRSWRFYDHFRTDVNASSRLPQVGTHTPVLSNDGADLAAALQTILETGDSAALAETVSDAFPGAAIAISQSNGGFETTMRQHGLLRPLSAMELSDGTLRFLHWVAALLSPRPAALVVLNEPETSLHPDLLPALGRLIVRAAQHSQVLVVSHANRPIASLEEEADCVVHRLSKDFGETSVTNRDVLERPAWRWVGR